VEIFRYGQTEIDRMNPCGLTSLAETEFERYRKRYSPYGSVASLYLRALSGM
jgi:DNA-3-methyladenine glycosylase II